MYDKFLWFYTRKHECLNVLCFSLGFPFLYKLWHIPPPHIVNYVVLSTQNLVSNTFIRTNVSHSHSFSVRPVYRFRKYSSTSSFQKEPRSLNFKTMEKTSVNRIKISSLKTPYHWKHSEFNWHFLLYFNGLSVPRRVVSLR